MLQRKAKWNKFIHWMKRKRTQANCFPELEYAQEFDNHLLKFLKFFFFFFKFQRKDSPVGLKFSPEQWTHRWNHSTNPMKKATPNPNHFLQKLRKVVSSINICQAITIKFITSQKIYIEDTSAKTQKTRKRLRLIVCLNSQLQAKQGWGNRDKKRKRSIGEN